MPYTEMTLHQEEKLNEVICEGHPHKTLLQEWRPRFYVIRKGWGSLRRSFEKADREVGK